MNLLYSWIPFMLILLSVHLNTTSNKNKLAPKAGHYSFDQF